MVVWHGEDGDDKVLERVLEGKQRVGDGEWR